MYLGTYYVLRTKYVLVSFVRLEAICGLVDLPLSVPLHCLTSYALGSIHARNGVNCTPTGTTTAVVTCGWFVSRIRPAGNGCGRALTILILQTEWYICLIIITCICTEHVLSNVYCVVRKGQGGGPQIDDDRA